MKIPMLKKYYQKIKSVLGLSFSLARANFKLKNEGSYLGVFWYLLSPIIMFVSLLAIFSDRLGNKGIPMYPLYLLLGIIMFNLFQNITSGSTGAIMSGGGIIKSIKFPTEAFVLQIMIQNLFSHFFQIALLAAGLIIMKVSLLGILLYFFILVFFCCFIYGFSLILASLSVYFMDLPNIWSYLVKILWFSMPIFYAIGGQKKLFYVNLMNPVYYFITIARETIIYSKMPETWIIFGAIAYAGIFFAAGVLIFNKLKLKFAELI